MQIRKKICMYVHLKLFDIFTWKKKGFTGNETQGMSNLDKKFQSVTQGLWMFIVVSEMWKIVLWLSVNIQFGEPVSPKACLTSPEQHSGMWGPGRIYDRSGSPFWGFQKHTRAHHLVWGLTDGKMEGSWPRSAPRKSPCTHGTMKRVPCTSKWFTCVSSFTLCRNPTGRYYCCPHFAYLKTKV